MKKILFLVFVFLTLVQAFGQRGEEPLTGPTDEKALQEYSWFREGYQKYNPDSASIEKLKNGLSAYTFLVFGGTWCGDTKKLLPAFYKIMDQAGYSQDNIDLYFVNENKKSPERREKKYKIKAIPVFILLKDGNEISRITESVRQPLEKELLLLFR